ncbi:O-antigen polymerase [Priestia megaterium]|uniref:O-antigen polymerase n=1 Tax=Priestia megaterium TaxID=1404 RepID=UPI003242C727
MNRNKLSTKLILVFCFFLIGILFMLYKPDNLTNVYNGYYTFILFSYFLVGGAFVFCITIKGIYIFEPITMVMPLTIITFSVEPLICIISGDTTLLGFEVFEGCYKATLIYMVASLTYLFGYFTKIRTSNEKKVVEKEVTIRNKVIVNNKKKILFLAYIFWIVGFSVQLLDFLKQGYSYDYIFSLGAAGSFEATESSLGAITNIRFFMLAPLLYLDLYSDKKALKWTMRILAILLTMLRTSRWIILIYILSPIVLHYVKEKKKPSKKVLIPTFILSVFLIGAMQYFRASIRDGSGLDSLGSSGFSVSYIWGAFQLNFDLFKTLYGAVVYFPGEHAFTLGKQMIFLTIATIIPRAIWPTKPISVIEELKANFLGSGAVDGHWAYAQLTEFYIEFGITGVIVLMFGFSKLCKYLIKLCKTNNDHNLIIYSIMFPMLMQLVIRGYMPNNFWSVIFLLLPIWAINIIIRLKWKR